MALFLYWAFQGIDPGALWQALRSISPGWAAAIILTSYAALMFRAWRWRLLMRPFAPAVSTWDAAVALAICYAANLAIPRSGEALRAVSLNWTRGLPIGAVLATVVVERILDLIWLVVFVGLSLLLLRARITQAFPWLEPLSLLALAGCLALLGGLALVSLYRERAVVLVNAALSRLSPRLAGGVCGLLEKFLHGLEALHSPSAYAEILLSSILLNLGYVLIIYEAFACFGATQALGLGAALVIMAISSIGVVVPTPGGTGTYHFFFGQSLHLLYDIPAPAALACATATHALAALAYLALGGPALWLQWRGRKNR